MFIKNILLAFQLENYQNIRFLKFIYSHPRFWVFWGKRQFLVWTSKAQLLCLISVVVSIALIVFVFLWKLWWLVSLLSTAVVFLLFPFYYILWAYLVWPLDKYLKNKKIAQAKARLWSFKNLRVIWITWSYWKTSQKEMLESILSKKFKVLASAWNKNTPLWISDVILNDLDESHEIFIVEMWAYQKWDIKELCDIVNPEIWILTGITIQHLERFGSLENTIDAKFELIESIDKKWLAVMDWANENIISWLSNKKNSIWVENIKAINYSWAIQYWDNFTGLSFEYNWSSIYTRLLAPHNVTALIMCFEAAEYLWMQIWDVLWAIWELDYVEHRMQLIYNPTTNVRVIDDSYNGNIEWVKSIVKLLAHTKTDGRKLYLTPGLVELGDQSERVHIQLWTMLAWVVDKVLLIKNHSTDSIIQWLMNGWYNKKDIVVYPDTSTAHADIWNILQSWDSIVFQNDWTDNYF